MVENILEKKNESKGNRIKNVILALETRFSRRRFD